ncbi:hypothetical protein BMS3Abin02_01968 [bacterium BMS3Abin02]|nr:hypothetical protein BMS3Abin02_01968 [bacterium BMS3Abin02]HDL49356.1 DUF4388 domain-containing protein [Actinomycetota bacterium]
MSVATLKGTFDSFPLPDVLRLVAASKETGLLQVDSPTLGGRIFVVDGQITYATTRSDDQLIDDLARMEHISEEEREAIERRAVQLEDVLSSRAAVLGIFFGYQVTEVLVRLLTLVDGSFSFDVGVMTKHQTAYRVDVEAALEAAAVRSAEWEKIHKIIPGVDTSFRMAPVIDDEITIDPNRWAILAALATARTPREIAVALKIFEFDAAKRLAELATSGLIVVEERRSEPVVIVEGVPEHRPETASEEQEPTSEEQEMTSKEAAELLGSFIALTDRPEEEQAELEEAPEEQAPEEQAPEEQDEEEEDVDLARRWRRLRKDHRSIEG